MRRGAPSAPCASARLDRSLPCRQAASAAALEIPEDRHAPGKGGGGSSSTNQAPVRHTQPPSAEALPVPGTSSRPGKLYDTEPVTAQQVPEVLQTKPDPIFHGERDERKRESSQLHDFAMQARAPRPRPCRRLHPRPFGSHRGLCGILPTPDPPCEARPLTERRRRAARRAERRAERRAARGVESGAEPSMALAGALRPFHLWARERDSLPRGREAGAR